jgi:3alpha(or 20beta)-hydroxysteroid dehydrogenase
MKRFEGKTVLITGAARGQGASHARGFVAQGANVVLADIREESGRALADELGEQAMFIKLDVSVASDWDTAVEQAESRFGPVAVLVNNAGILAPAVSIVESDPADWDDVIATNLKGTYLGIRAVVPSMKRAGGGSIVNIASTSGHVGSPMLAPYVSSKWGVRGLTQTAANELARDMIRVNAISPGVINTPLITEALRPGEVPVSDHFSAEPFAVPRMGEPTEVTRLVMFLTSEEAAFITGSDYVIDGGMLLGPVPRTDN